MFVFVNGLAVLINGTKGKDPYFDYQLSASIGLILVKVERRKERKLRSINVGPVVGVTVNGDHSGLEPGENADIRTRLAAVLLIMVVMASYGTNRRVDEEEEEEEKERTRHRGGQELGGAGGGIGVGGDS